MAASKEEGAEEVSVTWESLLKDATRGNKTAEATLVVFGDVGTGKRSLLGAAGFISGDSNAEFGYAFCAPPDDDTGDADLPDYGTNVWWISEPSHVDILDISERSVFVICADMTRPHTVKRCIETWWEAMKKFGSATNVPTILVGTKSDHLVKMDSRKRAFLLWWLGNIAMQKGAAHICTSATAELNVKELRQYVHHVNAKHTRSAAVSPCVSDFSRLFVPIGTDDAGRLKALLASSGISADSTFEDVFPDIEEADANKVESTDVAPDIISSLAFLESLKTLSDVHQKSIKPKARVVKVSRSPSSADAKTTTTTTRRKKAATTTTTKVATKEGEGAKAQQLQSFFANLVSKDTKKKKKKKTTTTSRKEGVRSSVRTRGMRTRSKA
eukprot:g1663.t1